MALFDSIFGSEFYLTEDNVGDNNEDDQDEYSMDDADQDNQGGEPEAQSDDQDEYSMDDADQGNDTDGNDNPGDTANDDADQDEYSMDDADQDNQGEDGNDQEDNPSETAGDEDNDSGDEYSMDDSDGGDDNNDQDGDSDDSGDNQSSDDEDASSSDDPNAKLKELEKSIFDQLSPEQQAAKTKELKDLFIAVYDKCQKITTMVSEIDKLPSQAKIYDYIMNSLTDLQKYIRDYLDTLFDSKTYIENMTELKKYMVVLDTVNGVFEEMKKNVEDADK